MIFVYIFIGCMALVMLSHAELYPLLFLCAGVWGIARLVSGAKMKGGAQADFHESTEGEETACRQDAAVTGCYYRGGLAMGQVDFSYRNGCVFEGMNYGLTPSFCTYTYANGFVRRAGTVVARYRNGYIWLGRVEKSIHEADARYDGGYVYSGAQLPCLSTAEAVGRYTENDEGGAACAVAALLS